MEPFLKRSLWFSEPGKDHRFCVCKRLPGDANIALYLLLFSGKAALKKRKGRKE